ncbi:MAG: hypothetical protein ACJ75T_08250 [Solirubrobacterales bacterium]
MQKFLLPLLLASLALAAAAGPAQALSLPLPPLPLVAGEEADDAEAGDELAGADEGEDGEEVTAENCTIEDEEDVQLCAEIAAEEAEEARTEECVLEDATARVSANPGNDSVALTVRYEADSPASVAVDARLTGGKGSVHLGSDHARFRRSGTFRDTFVLGEKRMDRVLAAREFDVELQAVNTPRYCRLDLNGALHRAKRSLRAGGRDRSGGPGRTRGK